MIFAVAVAELHLPAARSLKDKRRVVRAAVDRIHHRYRISVIESGHQDLHQRAQIAVAAVRASETEMEELLAGVRRALEDQHEALVIAFEPRYLEGVT